MTMHPKSFPIKNLSQDDQPREKLIDKGARILSDAELVAILIGSGSFQFKTFDLFPFPKAFVRFIDLFLYAFNYNI